ncbi:MAG: tetratricopeptide repeat protein [Candidatus Dadabacteria bacterium]|nr:tetratricopeptide repeat protein [Candidatus Dadabacteria bacterium]NIS09187.1 tetratricopeptide repeat protein [Candidatus Dadabacteria bacterium]NIV41803.1 tetratricopeptide repeat protein [Candidatus Dadabacteria bacterium]NIX15746.1 tetratricopeptide repeat protein [Candidatus Dadabacteria bacterium]NIY22618.1 tetratricopeptide repeat protein [Candidatus Dadabacteria bacterium]
MNTETDSISKLLEYLKQKFTEDPNSDLLLAGISKSLGDSDTALSLLFSAIRENQNNISAKLMIAEIYYERWMIDEAKKYLEQVVDQSPNNEKALDMLSKIYNSESDSAKALDILYKKLIFCSNKPQTLFEIESLNNKSSTESSHFDITQKIKNKLSDNYENIRHTTPEANLITETMADLYINQGYYEKAAEILQQLLRKHPNDPHLKTKLSFAEFAVEYIIHSIKINQQEKL